MSGNELFLVIDEGCQECGVASELVGSFWDKAQAEAAMEQRETETGGWCDGGQTDCRLYRVPLPLNDGGVV